MRIDRSTLHRLVAISFSACYLTCVASFCITLGHIAPRPPVSLCFTPCLASPCLTLPHLTSPYLTLACPSSCTSIRPPHLLFHTHPPTSSSPLHPIAHLHLTCHTRASCASRSRSQLPTARVLRNPLPDDTLITTRHLTDPPPYIYCYYTNTSNALFTYVYSISYETKKGIY